MDVGYDVPNQLLRKSRYYTIEYDRTEYFVYQ